MKEICNREAVSPVVGVMLMLVVTIIIASVVSAFAGGMAGDQKAAPQVTISAEPIFVGLGDTNTDNGIEFENRGGDTFMLTDINVQLESSSTKYTITPSDVLPDDSCLTPGITNGGYFVKVGGSSLNDMSISPGDKFILYAEGNYDSTSSGQLDSGKYLTWSPKNTDGGFGAQFGTKIGYSIIDRETSDVIASGSVVFT